MNDSIKKHISALAVLTIALTSLFGCADDRPQISGNLVSLPDGKVWLYRYDSTLTLIDSAVSHDGRFRFTQPDYLPDALFLNFELYPNFYLPVMTGEGDVFVSGNFNYQDDIRVSGTESNDALREYAASIRNFDIMAQAIELELGQWQGGAPEDSARYASLASKRDSLKLLIADSRARFVRRNPTSIVSAMFLNFSMTDSTDIFQIDSLLDQLDTAIVYNAFVRRMEERYSKLAK